MKHEGWEILDELALDLTPAKIAALERFEHLLIDIAIPRGMIAANDMARLRDRHIVDSLRAVPVLPPTCVSVCDLGSGGGLPGIPVAIARPDLAVILVEMRRNRASFLQEAVADLGLGGVVVHDGRSETLRASVDVCLSRAFGDPEKTWKHARLLMAADGIAIYWAGTRFNLATSIPGGVHAELFESPALARSGPLVIMSRQ